jgi:hypothetical protein
MSRHFLKTVLPALALLAFTINASAQHASQGRQFWFAGVDPVVQGDRHVNYPADYMDLFKPEAPWSVGASALTAFKISTQLVLRGSDEQLSSVFAGLKARHIALAIELGVLVNSDACGKGTEGFGSPPAVETVAKRIKSLGGELDYVAMDEPVTWGHAKQGKNKLGYVYCEYSVDQLADQAAAKAAILKRYFPNVRIGVIDAVNSRLPGLVDAEIGFLDAFHKKSGLRPEFLHADVAWDSNWRPGLEDLARRLRARGIRLGVVCDGDLNPASDEQWVALSLQRCRTLVDDPNIRPDDLVIQTWTAWPHRMLPETDPAAWAFALKSAVMSLRGAPNSASLPGSGGDRGRPSDRAEPARGASSR